MIGIELPLTQLSSLNPKKRLAFGILVIERMFPALIAFSMQTGFDVSCYLQGKEEAWNALRDDPIDRTLIRACTQSSPDTEKFSHELTSYALNAALALVEVLEFVIDAGTEHLEQLLNLARDSVYLYLSDLEPSVVSSQTEVEKIKHDSLMEREALQEFADINFLNALPEMLDDSAILSLKNRAITSSHLVPLAP